MHTREKLPPEAESSGFTALVLERNTSFRLPRWHGRAAHSYADDLAQIVWTQAPWYSKLGGSSLLTVSGEIFSSFSLSTLIKSRGPNQWHKVHTSWFPRCYEEFCLLAVIVGQNSSVNSCIQIRWYRKKLFENEKKIYKVIPQGVFVSYNTSYH